MRLNNFPLFVRQVNNKAILNSEYFLLNRLFRLRVDLKSIFCLIVFFTNTETI